MCRTHYRRWLKGDRTVAIREWDGHGSEHSTGREWREAAITLLGGECAHCGYDEDIRALQLDHVNNDGYKPKRNYSGSYAFYKAVYREERTDVQVLCANCNWIKRIDLLDDQNKESG